MRRGEGDRRSVGENGTGVARLYEAPIAAHAHHVGEREQHVRVEVLGIALVGACPHEQLRERWDSVSDERAVVARERHDHVEQVPQPIVDRRRRE